MAIAHPILDEYEWERYTQEYSLQVDQMEETAGVNGSDFLVKNSVVTKAGIDFKDNLHFNWRGLYSTIFECEPQTIFECGCGGMYHLKNISTLFPNIGIHGCDLLQSQVNFGAKRFDIPNNILQNVSVRNFTHPVDDLGNYDFVYSHAVMMHLSQENGLKFLANMLKISNKYVYFIEGEQHDYLALLRELKAFEDWKVERPALNNSWLLIRK